jgi:hypothetical protein
MRTLAMVTIALAASSAAHAHELWCEKTVNGQELTVVWQYPATLEFSVWIRNTHLTDASVIESATDSMHELDLALPMSLPVGGEVRTGYTMTIDSFEECARIAGTDPMWASAHFSNWAEIGWDLGSTMCHAEVVCERPEGEQPPPGGATRTMGFFKTHETALSACLAEGSIDLGFVTVTTLADALGMLWGSPRAFEDGTARGELDKLRFLLGRQTLVAICNVRLFDALPSPSNLIDRAVAALSGRDCTLIAGLIDAVDAFNNSNDSVALPDGFDKGPATPRHAASLAVDPTSPSGEVCQ